MQNDDYKNYILDQLRLVSDIRVKRMFGSFGLYMDGVFFGILSDNCLYFKTNDKIRDKYEKLGMKPFQPSVKQKLKNYYEVPPEIVEDPYSLKEWSEESATL